MLIIRMNFGDQNNTGILVTGLVISRKTAPSAKAYAVK